MFRPPQHTLLHHGFHFETRRNGVVEHYKDGKSKKNLNSYPFLHTMSLVETFGYHLHYVPKYMMLFHVHEIYGW